MSDVRLRGAQRYAVRQVARLELHRPEQSLVHGITARLRGLRLGSLLDDCSRISPRSASRKTGGKPAPLLAPLGPPWIRHRQQRGQTSYPGVAAWPENSPLVCRYCRQWSKTRHSLRAPQSRTMGPGAIRGTRRGNGVVGVARRDGGRTQRGSDQVGDRDRRLFAQDLHDRGDCSLGSPVRTLLGSRARRWVVRPVPLASPTRRSGT